jgi:predicted nucleotidyltransferase
MLEVFMELKPQDIYVALKLVVLRNEPCTMQRMGESLGLSASQIHASIQRLIKANLIRKDKGYKVISANLKAFLLHGIRFVFVPEIGEPCRGVATASFAPPLNKAFTESNELPHVWPDSEGDVRGISFSPLHKSAAKAARKDKELYELLALVDAIRGGRARERKMAADLITSRLSKQKLDEVERLKSKEYSEQIADICKRFHVRKLALFGSAARRELKSGSDIDFLVEFEPGLTPAISGVQEMKQILSTLVDRPVDLVTPVVLKNPFRRKAIMRDLENLYVA